MNINFPLVLLYEGRKVAVVEDKKNVKIYNTAIQLGVKRGITVPQPLRSQYNGRTVIKQNDPLSFVKAFCTFYYVNELSKGYALSKGCRWKNTTGDESLTDQEIYLRVKKNFENNTEEQITKLVDTDTESTSSNSTS